MKCGFHPAAGPDDRCGVQRTGKAQMTDSHLTRRHVSRGLAASAVAAGMLPIRARAQQHYPNRPVRFVLPFAAAGVADITARLAAEKLGDKLGQRFVVENQPGPGGIAAARAVLSQAADGYTIGLVTNGTAISAAIYKALPFDPVKEFDTISTIGAFDLVFATNAESGFKTLEEFIKAAQAQPGALSCGTINVGGTQNLAAELLRLRLGSNSRSFLIAEHPTSSSPSCATTCSSWSISTR